MHIPPVFLEPKRFPAPCLALFARPSDLCVACRTVIFDGVTSGGRDGEMRRREKAESSGARGAEQLQVSRRLNGVRNDVCSIVMCGTLRVEGVCRVSDAQISRWCLCSWRSKNFAESIRCRRRLLSDWLGVECCTPHSFHRYEHLAARQEHFEQAHKIN